MNLLCTATWWRLVFSKKNSSWTNYFYLKIRLQFDLHAGNKLKKSCNLIWRIFLFFFCQIIMQYFLSHSGFWKIKYPNAYICEDDESPVKNDFWKNYHRLLLGNKTNLESLIVSNSIKFQNSVFLLINLIIVIKLTI